MVEHNALTGASIHEPKGASSAAADEVMTATGAGGIVFKKLDPENLDASTIKNTNKIYLNYELVDISTAKSDWLVVPVAGKITKIWSVIDGAITVADAILSFEIATVAVTNGNITVAFTGSAAGDVDSSTPTALNVLAAGQALEIITNGGSTGSINATLTFEIDIT
jgi:hypothetical protein